MNKTSHLNIVGHPSTSNVFIHGQIKAWKRSQRLGGLEVNLIKRAIGVVRVVKLREILFLLDIGNSLLSLKVIIIVLTNMPYISRCFCHSMSEPKQIRLATPHSCGNSCSRVRESGCGHPCPLKCHPGPCPPCQITTRPECYCPLKKVLAFRCGIDAIAGRDLSCGNICRRTLGCKKHSCERVCHSGECNKCEVKDMARCWCGKVEKEIECEEGSEQQCFVEGQPPWIGRFSCDKRCERCAYIFFK